MGMTIEEAIRRIDEHNYIHQRKEPRAVYITEALNMAISTMRKYQKIVDIVSLNDEEFKQCGLKELKEILEVIADGDEE